MGYLEAQNVVIEYRWADGQYDRLPTMVEDLLGRQVAEVFAAGPPAAPVVRLPLRRFQSSSVMGWTGEARPVESLNRPAVMLRASICSPLS